MKRALVGSLLILLLGSVTYYYPNLQETHEPPLRLHRLPPGLALKIFSMGNKELMAAFIFFETEFYFGEKVGFKREVPELKIIYDSLNKATDLDPYNMDCYYFAQGALSWIKPAIPALNRLLEKGLRYRTWDWYIPFFIGANYYFKLNDPEKAAYYMKKAARLAPNSPLLTTLTARMLYQADKTEAAIVYLRSMIAETRNPLFKKRYEKRLKALEAIHYLEKGVKAYRKSFGKNPVTLDELLRTGLIDHIPVDPYGGEFLIDEDGRIYTTSKMAEGWRKHGGHKDIESEQNISKRGS